MTVERRLNRPMRKPTSFKEMLMKSILVAAAAMLAVVSLSSGPSEAAGCVKGAVVGGIAGHFVGHGLLGAVQAVPLVIMKPIGATRSGAGPIAAGIMTGEIPPDMGRALRGVPLTSAEQCAAI